MNDVPMPGRLTLDLPTFRQTLLAAVNVLRAAQPGVRIHLLYTPELQDPLGLVGDTRRDTARIQAPAHLQAVSPSREHAARVLSLDCTRVAAYLLESDPGLDDPAFEQSITQSHAEVCLNQSVDAEINNDEREFFNKAIGGWLISNDNAATLAARLRVFSSQQRKWVRWTNPDVLSTLWPTMTVEQRFAMLGDATWLAFDHCGSLCHFAGEPPAHGASALPAPAVTATTALTPGQYQMLRNVPLVRDLITAWKEMLDEDGHALPVNAEQQLHAHARRAQAYGLDADSVAIYCMTAVQLNRGATEDAEWIRLVQGAGEQGLVIRDLLASLSDDFWERHDASTHNDA